MLNSQIRVVSEPVIPEISEFSYGFALTNELVGRAQLRSAPIFPNLVEEGRVGGGYDVRLDMPGVPMFLQFKRADCMTTRNAGEIQKGANLSTPFHRFHLMDGTRSDQHRLLLRLDNGTNEVYYAAPRFHRFSEINSAWNANEITTRSIFVTPRQIGRLSLGPHTIAYDGTRAYCCSDPREVEFVNNDGLLRTLTLRLRQEKQSLREQLPHLVSGAKIAAQPIQDSEEKMEGMALERALPAVETRTPRVLTPPQQQLRELSDIAAKVFGTQLIVVQTA
jgi:hypothetical protein